VHPPHHPETADGKKKMGFKYYPHQNFLFILAFAVLKNYNPD